MNSFDNTINRRNTGSVKWDFMEQKLGLEGSDLLPMWVSDYDFQAPQQVLDRLAQDIAHGIFGYSERQDDYYQAVIDWFKNQHNTDIEKEWITTIHGVLPGIAMALQMLTQENDQIVIQSPGYGSFRKIIELNDRRVLNNPLIESDGHYQLDFSHLEDCFASGAKALIFCNPHNPTGRAWNEEEITQVAELCKKHDVWLISDEIWSDLTLTPNVFNSTLSLPSSLTDKLIVATAASKTFGLSSLRISNFIIPNSVLKEQFVRRLDAHGMDCFNSLSMSAATTAYQECETWLADLKHYLQHNIETLNGFIKAELPHIRFTKPEATYLAWLDCRSMKLSNAELERKLIAAGIVPSMGCAFGEAGSGFIRLNLGCPAEILSDALVRLKIALGADR
ncbi:aminotransferase [Vibrio lentus]|uniref:MalY/PatB family protein n=1 Tax=Vibrio lentus TaxID=136468 RepID=UPI000C83EE2C|nr:MalY/PatB family protein [Vibrio lentus]MCC4816633.1 pyridoxal phosphate-dependent aminotransferase [Vibrio lentus]PMG71785.1 aminotransferase [Vibrio lentus]PMK94035.1 aminotransferase [Vibrio lentus]PML23094.1 aminotransferase [Vibrio lentus]PMM20946.1 aminotransferase [Vibrio lentus]